MRKSVLLLVLVVVSMIGLAVPALAGTYRGHSRAQMLRIELTGYSWQDNTPPGSGTICCGVLHRHAGGTGTYSDPITVAVPGSGSKMQFKPRTKFYLAVLHRYVIVEDSGATRYKLPHLDVWIDGRSGTRAATDRCMSALTGATTAIQDPSPGLPVMAGPIYSRGKCRIP